MQLTPRLQAVAEILKSSIKQPALSRRLMRQLPAMVRGRRYANDWPAQKPVPGSICNVDQANPLQTYFNSHTSGRGIWKWTHYLDIYHRHFQRFIGKEVHVLEVGVYSGGSLEMWREYFGPQCHVYGIDIREECKALETDSVKIFIGDQGNREFWQRFRQEVPVLDILIDDGGHLLEQQIVTLEEVLPHLRPGGVYVCEDIHGDFNRFGAYVRGLAANLDIFAQRIGPGQGKELLSDTASFQADIHSIHTYPYVVVIEKRCSPVSQFRGPCHGNEWTWPATGRRRSPKQSRPGA
jgi:SAM-dependent methyltransferase